MVVVLKIKKAQIKKKYLIIVIIKKIYVCNREK